MNSPTLLSNSSSNAANPIPAAEAEARFLADVESSWWNANERHDGLDDLVTLFNDARLSATTARAMFDHVTHDGRDTSALEELVHNLGGGWLLAGGYGAIEKDTLYAAMASKLTQSQMDLLGDTSRRKQWILGEADAIAIAQAAVAVHEPGDPMARSKP